MRLVLAFLAVVALLASPVTAAAAQAACDKAGSGTMAGMVMPSTPSMDQPGAETSKGDPCCDHADHHGKTRDASCAQACATTCGVAIALTTSFDGALFAPRPAMLAPAPAVRPDPHEPAGLRRPPKSIV